MSSSILPNEICSGPRWEFAVKREMSLSELKMLAMANRASAISVGCHISHSSLGREELYWKKKKIWERGGDQRWSKRHRRGSRGEQNKENKERNRNDEAFTECSKDCSKSQKSEVLIAGCGNTRTINEKCTDASHFTHSQLTHAEAVWISLYYYHVISLISMTMLISCLTRSEMRTLVSVLFLMNNYSRTWLASLCTKLRFEAVEKHNLL